jgi:hypothetical protein
MIVEVNDMYIDEEGRKMIVGYFVSVGTLEDARLIAQMVAERLQLFSRAKLVTQRLLFDNAVTILRNVPRGTTRRRLHVFCQANRPQLSRAPHTFEIVVPDPIPEMLNAEGTRLDETKLAAIDFVENVLRLLTDIHGHEFERVMSGIVIQH